MKRLRPTERFGRLGLREFSSQPGNSALHWQRTVRQRAAFQAIQRLALKSPEESNFGAWIITPAVPEACQWKPVPEVLSLESTAIEASSSRRVSKAIKRGRKWGLCLEPLLSHQLREFTCPQREAISAPGTRNLSL